jgi:hypothetical protein
MEGTMDIIGLFFIIIAIGMLLFVGGYFVDPDGDASIVGALIVIFAAIFMLLLGGIAGIVVSGSSLQ